MPVRTLKASGGQYTGPFHWDNRRFTVEELKRLQTFPDNYFISGNYNVVSKQIGNSVPPQFARILALSILNQIFEVELPFELHYLEENEKLSFRKEKTKRTKEYRKKAQDAIINLIQSDEKLEVPPQKYSLSLLENFELIQSENGDYFIDFIPQKGSWHFKVFESEEANSPPFTSCYEIRIKPSSKETLISKISNVNISVYSSNPISYVIAWKAFELELSRNNLKADLIQLNGYYQYPSQLDFSVELIEQTLKKSTLWNVISLISNDELTGSIKPLSNFADRYGIKESEMFALFFQLRDLGFEIRNNNTNPEIELGHFLIPYKFPTLTNRSVQLKKNL